MTVQHEQDTNEHQLLMLCRSGDEAAYRALVTRYQRYVVSVARHFLENPDDIDEIAQEVFLAVFKALPTFREDSSISTWIYRITVNNCINWRKRLSFRFRKHVLSLYESQDRDDGPARIEAIPSNQSDPVEDLLRAERIRLVQGALKKLPITFRTVLILRDLEDLPYEEIARILEISVGTVKSRINRARTRLRGVFLKDFPDEV